MPSAITSKRFSATVSMTTKAKGTNYARGRRFEWELAAGYRKAGLQVIRAAGSHGPFDLIVLPGTITAGVEFPVPLFIQCKVVRGTPNVNAW